MVMISEMTHSSDTCEGAADDDVGEGRMDSEWLWFLMVFFAVAGPVINAVGLLSRRVTSFS